VDALPDQVALNLGQRPEDVDDEFAAVGGSVIPPGQTPRADPRSARTRPVAKDLEIEARTVGITARTYRAARKAEGVIVRKEQTLNGHWIVPLPESPPQDR